MQVKYENEVLKLRELLKETGIFIKDDNQYLINHHGITEKNVKVTYSNGETGEQ